jgi:hypothetical protein
LHHAVAAPDSSAPIHAAAPDTLVHLAAPDTLAHAPAAADTLAHTPAVGDTVRRASAKPFEQIPLATNYGSRHTLSNLAIIGGVALIGASFALGNAANDAYDAYLRETDPGQIDELYDRTVALDRGSSGSLLLGEALVCLGLYGRFLSHPTNALAWRLEPGRCALSYRF